MLNVDVNSDGAENINAWAWTRSGGSYNNSHGLLLVVLVVVTVLLLPCLNDWLCGR